MQATYVYNGREIPGDLPIAVYHEMVIVTEEEADLDSLPWGHPCMEYLDPQHMKRLRAKALVWKGQTGEFPTETEVRVWREYRWAWKVGEMPPPSNIALSYIEVGKDNLPYVRCGFEGCGARWSDLDVRRCNLCGSRIEVINKEGTNALQSS